jgi:hypothetical protein
MLPRNLIQTNMYSHQGVRKNLTCEFGLINLIANVKSISVISTCSQYSLALMLSVRTIVILDVSRRRA